MPHVPLSLSCLNSVYNASRCFGFVKVIINKPLITKLIPFKKAIKAYKIHINSLFSQEQFGRGGGVHYLPGSLPSSVSHQDCAGRGAGRLVVAR